MTRKITAAAIFCLIFITILSANACSNFSQTEGTPVPTLTPTPTPNPTTTPPILTPLPVPTSTPTITPSPTPTPTPTPTATPTAIPTATPAPVLKPSLIIMSPMDGASVTTTNIIISVQVANFNLVDKLGKVSVPGEGHIHYYMDTEVPTDPTMPAITGAGTYFATAATFHTWMNVPMGAHTFSAQLVNNDHKPVATQAIAKIKVTVAPPPLPTATTIELSARNGMFDPSIITVRAGAVVTINFTNFESGTQHNFALYDDVYDLTPYFSGQAIGGPASTVYHFTAPSVPGTYFFCDDWHRVDTSGQFVVVP